MLIDTAVTIAYKCPLCGGFEFFGASLFKLEPNKEHHLACRCNKSNVIIFKDNFKNYNIKIPCIGCGNEHEYVLSRKEMLRRDIRVFRCPETGLQQCFIGKDELVRKKIDSLEREFDELIDTFGYDSYFANTQVMLDSLNKIHDLAEQGNLCCECGNKDIELTLLSDKIHLRCRKCAASRVIHAASNNDLKDILTRQQLLLIDGFPAMDAGNGDAFTRKSDV